MYVLSVFSLLCYFLSLFTLLIYKWLKTIKTEAF